MNTTYTYSELIKKGLVFDASGIDNPNDYLWEKGIFNDVYYPIISDDNFLTLKQKTKWNTL